MTEAVPIDMNRTRHTVCNRVAVSGPPRARSRISSSSIAVTDRCQTSRYAKPTVALSACRISSGDGLIAGVSWSTYPMVCGLRHKTPLT